mgnify:CR=1 FL=1
MKNATKKQIVITTIPPERPNEVLQRENADVISCETAKNDKDKQLTVLAQQL